MKSKCCNALASVSGNTTKYYVCHKCHNPCDVVEEQKETPTEPQERRLSTGVGLLTETEPQEWENVFYEKFPENGEFGYDWNMGDIIKFIKQEKEKSESIGKREGYEYALKGEVTKYLIGQARQELKDELVEEITSRPTHPSAMAEREEIISLIKKL